MRFLIINSIREYGGGEGWVLATARGLQARGHEVRVACQPGSALEARLRSTPGSQEPGGGTRRRRVIQEPGAYPIRMPHDLSIGACLALATLCRRFRPDAVLLCNQRAARLGAPAARLAGVPVVVMRNGLEGSFKNKPGNRWLARTCITDFVLNAEALRQELLGFGWVAPERATVIYNGIDPERVRPRRSREETRASLGLPGTAPVVACVARLADGKGQDDLVRAVATLHSRHPDLRVLIVGDGPRRTDLEAQVAAAGLSDSVSLLGFRDDIPDLLAAVDALVIASDREGLPNIALEAMAAARPVIATAVSGTPEAVVDGDTGWLVPPRAPDALATAIDDFLRDPDRARVMGERGRARVHELFRADRALDRWEAYLLDRLAAQTTPRRLHTEQRVESGEREQERGARWPAAR
jgi:glycosyltransferase involved in cell wall biosynthesis